MSYQLYITYIINIPEIGLNQLSNYCELKQITWAMSVEVVFSPMLKRIPRCS